MKKIGIIFVAAFLSNFVWENLHSYLYAAYQGGAITEVILARASLFDALVIVIMALPFLYISFFKKRAWIIIIGGVIIAILNEWYGLGTGRWEYNSFMPVVPLIEVGLTPVIQLGLLGYISYLFGERLVTKPR